MASTNSVLLYSSTNIAWSIENMRAVVCIFGATLALCGCVPGHTHSPLEANVPLPVTLYPGHVVTVQNGLIGHPSAGLGITAGWAPGMVAGLHAGAGVQPISGRVGVALGGVGIGPGIEAPAQALEYTVELDRTKEVVQITQYVLPEDVVIGPGQPVTIKVIGQFARVLPPIIHPLGGPLPPPPRGERGQNQLPGQTALGGGPQLGSPPHDLDNCFGLAPKGTCHPM